MFRRESAAQDVVARGHDLDADAPLVGVQLAGPQEEGLATRQHHDVHQESHDDAGVARELRRVSPCIGEVGSELDRACGLERGDDRVDDGLRVPRQQPRDRVGERGVVADPRGQRRGGVAEFREQTRGGLDVPQPAERDEAVAQGHDHLGLVVVVGVVARRGGGQIALRGEALLRLSLRRMGLNRQRLLRREDLEQVRQSAARADLDALLADPFVERATTPVTNVRGVGGVVAEPHLRLGLRSLRPSLELCDERRRPPVERTRVVAKWYKHAPTL